MNSTKGQKTIVLNQKNTIFFFILIVIWMNISHLSLSEKDQAPSSTITQDPLCQQISEPIYEINVTGNEEMLNILNGSSQWHILRNESRADSYYYLSGLYILNDTENNIRISLRDIDIAIDIYVNIIDADWRVSLELYIENCSITLNGHYYGSCSKLTIINSAKVSILGYHAGELYVSNSQVIDLTEITSSNVNIMESSEIRLYNCQFYNPIFKSINDLDFSGNNLENSKLTFFDVENIRIHNLQFVNSSFEFGWNCSNLQIYDNKFSNQESPINLQNSKVNDIQIFANEIASNHIGINLQNTTGNRVMIYGNDFIANQIAINLNGFIGDEIEIKSNYFYKNEILIQLSLTENEFVIEMNWGLDFLNQFDHWGWYSLMNPFQGVFNEFKDYFAIEIFGIPILTLLSFIIFAGSILGIGILFRYMKSFANSTIKPYDLLIIWIGWIESPLLYNSNPFTAVTYSRIFWIFLFIGTFFKITEIWEHNPPQKRKSRSLVKNSDYS